jgi:hypothetical protein
VNSFNYFVLITNVSRLSWDTFVNEFRIEILAVLKVKFEPLARAKRSTSFHPSRALSAALLPYRLELLQVSCLEMQFFLGGRLRFSRICDSQKVYLEDIELYCTKY